MSSLAFDPLSSQSLSTPALQNKDSGAHYWKSSVHLYDLETLLCLINKLDVLGMNRTGKGLHTKDKLVRSLHKKRHIKSFTCPTNAHTNYSKIIELLKTFKTTIIAPTCFGLHEPSSGNYSLCFAKLRYWFQYILVHVVNEVFGSLTTCIHWNQYCNFGKAQTVSLWWWFM